MFKSFFAPLLIVALAISALVVYLHLQNSDYPLYALIGGNLLWAIIITLSFFTVKKQMRSGDPNAIVRGKMMGLFIKFGLSIGSLVIYILLNNREVHKPSLFLFLGMYIVYAAIETAALSRLAKNI